MSGTLADRWGRIEASLCGEARRETVRMALSAWGFARLAYGWMHGGGDAPSASRVMHGGAFAYQYCVDVEYIRTAILGGVELDAMLAKLSAVSDWLERMGWTGMPREIRSAGGAVVLRRDAAGIHTDMMRCRESAMRLRASSPSAGR